MLMPFREEIETLDSAELAALLTMVQDVISERLEAPEMPNPREGYFAQGCGREVAQRDAEAVAQDAEKREQPASVKLYRTLEVLEYMSATLLVIDGAMYRIGCMGGDVEDRRPLMLLPVSMARTPRWSNNCDGLDDDALVRLELGSVIKVHGTEYRVAAPDAGGHLTLRAVR